MSSSNDGPKTIIDALNSAEACAFDPLKSVTLRVSPASPAGDEIDWEMVQRCAAEDQNDLGNSRRLRHRHGDSILHIQNVAYFAWDGRRWAEDKDLRAIRPRCHQVAEAILLEPLVMGATDTEQADIDAALEARTALKDRQDRLIQLVGEELKPAERKRRRAAVAREIEPLKDAILKGRDAEAAVSDRRAKRRRFAVSSGNTGKIEGMMSEAMAYLSRPHDDMDTEPLALNVRNGTLRFRRREGTKGQYEAVLHKHKRTDLITKLADVDYDPDAICPTFTDFLDTIMPTEPIREYLQRYFGYCATALTREQVFVLFHGEGLNGKSTLVDLMARVLGDYSISVPVSTLVNDARSGKGSEATPDLARLPGARLVRTAEPKEGLSFDESLIKSLTSNEPIPVRRLNQDFNDVYPTFKIVISANRRPTIKGNDDGIWRRVTLVPFDVQIPLEKIDKGLIDKLWAERSGVLNWIVEGARNYLELDGLEAPEEVKAATLDYREESDVVGAFIRAAVIVTSVPEDTVETGKLYSAFVMFCKRSGVTPFANSTFNRRLPKAAAKFGFSKGKSSISLYAGITIHSDFEHHHAAGSQSHEPSGESLGA